MLYCPKCGLHNFVFDGEKVYSCKECNYEFFFNAATAVGALIVKDDHLLTVVRGKPPSQGKLDLPGGFVDPDESLEQAVIRELQEELSISPTSLSYLTSGPNRYLYNTVEYMTCDVFFICQVEDFHGMKANDDISAFHWLSLTDISLESFAFHSVQKAIKKFIKAHD